MRERWEYQSMRRELQSMRERRVHQSKRATRASESLFEILNLFLTFHFIEKVYLI